MRHSTEIIQRQIILITESHQDFKKIKKHIINRNLISKEIITNQHNQMSVIKIHLVIHVMIFTTVSMNILEIIPKIKVTVTTVNTISLRLRKVIVKIQMHHIHYKILRNISKRQNHIPPIQLIEIIIKIN